MTTRQLTRPRTALRRRFIRRRRAGAMVLAALSVMLAVGAIAAAKPWWTVRLLRVAAIEWTGGDFLGTGGVVLQRSVYDCGPAALATLFLRLHLTPPSLDSLAKRAGTTPRGTSLGGLARAGRAFGVFLRPVRFTPARLTARLLPCIAWVSGGHFVVIGDRDDSGVLTVLDPQVGAYRTHETRFARVWSGEALIEESRRTGVGRESGSLPTNHDLPRTMGAVP
jgi:predicted double-glycine peptidase